MRRDHHAHCASKTCNHLQLKALLELFGITCYHPDHWGVYARQLDPEVHHLGKRNTQHIERTHLTLWPRTHPAAGTPAKGLHPSREKEKACVRNRPLTE
jgi:IS1 transposase